MKAAQARGNTRSIKGQAAKSVIPGKIKGSNIVDAFPTIHGDGKAQGAALADNIWLDAQREGRTWVARYTEIFMVGPIARAEMRRALGEHKKAVSAFDKLNSTSMSRSAMVRVSEVFTVSRAADKGLTLDACQKAWTEKGQTKDMPGPFVVTYARAHLNAGIAVNPRGRKALTAVEKVKRYILTNYTPKELPAFAALMASLAKRVKTPKDVETELGKHEDAKPKGKDRRVTKGVRTAAPATMAAA